MSPIFSRTICFAATRCSRRAAADFSKALDEITEKFLALPPVSVTASKRLSTSAFDLDFETFRREMNTALAGCFASDEHQRAMANIRSKKRS